jgi:hypothetical protein
METSEPIPYTRTLKPEPIEEADCPVCQHRGRALIEAAIYGLIPDAGDNEHVARRFGLGDGGPSSGEVVRRHRAAGHMRPRDYYEGRPIVIDDDGRARVSFPAMEEPS